MSPSLADVFEKLFRLRWCIARLGENDAMRWWDSHALTPQGRYALGRIFRRTTELSAADLSFRAARARHDDQVPDEELVHLFRLGEEIEGEFERWLMDRKAEGWQPDVPDLPDDDLSSLSVAEAMEAVNTKVDADFDEQTGSSVAVKTVDGTAAETSDQLLDIARRLAGAYTLSSPGELVAPYLRVRR